MEIICECGHSISQHSDTFGCEVGSGDDACRCPFTAAEVAAATIARLTAERDELVSAIRSIVTFNPGETDAQAAVRVILALTAERDAALKERNDWMYEARAWYRIFERVREIAGQPGGLTIQAVEDLRAERDAARALAEKLTARLDALIAPAEKAWAELDHNYHEELAAQLGDTLIAARAALAAQDGGQP